MVQDFRVLGYIFKSEHGSPKLQTGSPKDKPYILNTGNFQFSVPFPLSLYIPVYHIPYINPATPIISQNLLNHRIAVKELPSS